MFIFLNCNVNAQIVYSSILIPKSLTIIGKSEVAYSQIPMLNAPEVGVSCKIMSDIVNAYKAVPCSWPRLSANVYWLIHRAKTKQLKKKKKT